MRIYYNTSTGNSLYVSRMIGKEFKDCTLVNMGKALKEESFQCDDDIIGLVYPIHCESLPIVAYKFISKLKVKSDAYIFAVGVTGGGGAELSFIHINKLLNGQNNISNFATFKYISNYIRAGRNATLERVTAAMEANESLIVDFIQEIKGKKVKKIEDKMRIGSLMYMGWRELYKNKDKKFIVDDRCVSCRICEKICPIDNIEIKNGKPIWNGKCTDCMACINACPKESINIGKKTIKKCRYRNPNISLEELIDN